jgi:hypothetical protein
MRNTHTLTHTHTYTHTLQNTTHYHHRKKYSLLRSRGRDLTHNTSRYSGFSSDCINTQPFTTQAGSYKFKHTHTHTHTHANDFKAKLNSVRAILRKEGGMGQGRTKISSRYFSFLLVPIASCMLNICSATELYPRPGMWSLIILLSVDFKSI